MSRAAPLKTWLECLHHHLEFVAGMLVPAWSFPGDKIGREGFMWMSRNFVWCAWLLAAGSALAQRPMTLVDLMNVPVLTDPQLSPDGREVAFVESRADWKADRRITHIWKINPDGSGLIRGVSRSPRPRSAADRAGS